MAERCTRHKNSRSMKIELKIEFHNIEVVLPLMIVELDLVCISWARTRMFREASSYDPRLLLRRL